MLEIYRNSADREVSLDAPMEPLDGTLEVTVNYDGEELYDVPTVLDDPLSNKLSFILPFFLVQYDRCLEVHWRFDYIENGETYQFEDTTLIHVVTPLLTVAEVKAIVPELDDEAARIVESQIRHIIETITGVNFGYYVGSLQVTGHGESLLRLPRRLIDFTNIESDEYIYNTAAYSLANDGWYLKQNSASLLTIKEMPPEWSLDVGPVIKSPYMGYWLGFKPNAIYNITGRWGFSTVPVDVKLAARLLVEEYACPEVAYRDKMLKSIKTGDWSMQMSSVSWETTGHVRADQLIARYVLFDWALI